MTYGLSFAYCASADRVTDIWCTRHPGYPLLPLPTNFGKRENEAIYPGVPPWTLTRFAQSRRLGHRDIDFQAPGWYGPRTAR